ncbi:MAG: bifunctional 5,10-methylenetetrahydrofolate dehydrogenase/5,10-methenyltetrahydrofolate cyclohydrolase, partial [Acidimicrobiia bacterium]
EAIDPTKDADGLHPFNLGRLLLGRPVAVPATPQGVVSILEHYGIETAGRNAVIVGRSFLVGRPLALLLGAKGADATVIVAHSRTPDLAATTSLADILVVAAGRPHLISPEHVKPGATVIDVGLSRTDDGLVGDVDFDAVAEVAGAITPVPGGVGPMTITSLLRNTVAAAERRHSVR